MAKLRRGLTSNLRTDSFSFLENYNKNEKITFAKLDNPFKHLLPKTIQLYDLMQTINISKLVSRIAFCVYL